MSDNCMNYGRLTRKEQNSILRSIFGSLRSRPQHWTGKGTNILQHPTGYTVRAEYDISDPPFFRRSLQVYDETGGIVMNVLCISAFRLPSRVWRHIHNMRHQYKHPSVVAFERNFRDPEPEKQLPSEIYDAVQVGTEKTLETAR